MNDKSKGICILLWIIIVDNLLGVTRSNSHEITLHVIVYTSSAKHNESALQRIKESCEMQAQN
jgi:hypothetical protein